MPVIKDFRVLPFNLSNVDTAGIFIGRKSYPKLFSIENIFRVIIHTVLTIQIPGNWWDLAVDQKIKDKAKKFKDQYLKKSWHGKPGAHEIYYIDLRDLNEIIRANRNLFDPIIPDLDKWIINLEDIRIPRNIVAHMNFPSDIDQKRIEVFYSDCKNLLILIGSKITLNIP